MDENKSQQELKKQTTLLSNLKIQLRNYNGNNPWSLALHGMQK